MYVEKKIKTKSSYILKQNILYLLSNSVECIDCRMTYNMYVCMYVCMYSVYKVDYRGAAAPKNGQQLVTVL